MLDHDSVNLATASLDDPPTANRYGIAAGEGVGREGEMVVFTRRGGDWKTAWQLAPPNP